MQDTSFERIIAKDAIQSSLNSYALGMDLRNASKFLSAWHEDATWEINSAVGDRPLRGTGHAAIETVLHDLWALQQLVLHATTNHEIRLTGESTASGEGHAVVLGVTAAGLLFMDAVVYPDDRFERRDGTWRIAYRRVEVGVHTEFAASAASLQLFIGSGGAFGPAKP